MMILKTAISINCVFDYSTVLKSTVLKIFSLVLVELK